MSKLIKSTYAQKDDDVKTIKVRTFTYPSQLKSEGGHSTDHQFSDSSIGNDVHYLERPGAINKAELEAQRILKDARQQVDEWQLEIQQHEENVNKKAEQRFALAEKEGKELGYEAGIIEGKKAYDEEIAKAASIVEKAKVEYIQYIEDSEPVMLDMAMEVAKKIIGTALEEKKETWAFVLKEVIEEVRGRDEIKIYVHPDWYELTLQHQSELKQIALHSQELFIFPKSDLTKNSCIVETPFGQVDASVDSQLLELKRILRERLKEGVNDEAQ